jgi:hypothetical protein
MSSRSTTAPGEKALRVSRDESLLSPEDGGNYQVGHARVKKVSSDLAGPKGYHIHQKVAAADTVPPVWIRKATVDRTVNSPNVGGRRSPAGNGPERARYAGRFEQRAE